MFRGKYDEVRKIEEDKVDFSMKFSNGTKNDKKNGKWNVLTSTTLLTFYLPVSVLVFIYFIFVA